MRRLRTIHPVLPAETGEQDGLAYTLWLPKDRTPWGGIVILHGAGSCKESHHDFARAAIGLGSAVVAFDQRGHGASHGPLDGRVLNDVGSMATLLRRKMGGRAAPVALRGSSMGGYLAILAAPLIGARAVVAICPASADGLGRGLRAGTLGFDVDTDALQGLLVANDLHAATEELEVPLLLLHAEGDEQVPIQHSRELAARMRSPGSRLIALPGGHHRSIQHDDELQAVSLRFLQKALAGSSLAP